MNIKITGGTVYAYGGGDGGAGIGGGNGNGPARAGKGENISITGGTVTAEGGGDNGCSIGGGNKNQGSNILIGLNSVIMGRKKDGEKTSRIQNDDADMAKILVKYKYVSVDATKTFTKKVTNYIDEQGKSREVNATVVESWMNSRWLAGWYVVDKDVTITESTVTCHGNVKLILADNATLRIEGSSGYEGFKCTDDHSLTIYGQSAGTGKLFAIGGYGNAGIGGGSGTITINGGYVYAQGGAGAAGIGGSYGRAGSRITINGGTVEAYGGTKGGKLFGDGGAGIGGGYKGAGSDITINGGKVYAEGGVSAAGIGGGEKAGGYRITIKGGTVEAHAGLLGAGIGGGGSGNPKDDGGNGEFITISGGIVYAYGGLLGGSGIGAGNSFLWGTEGKGANIYIDGGTVFAMGGLVGGGGIGSGVGKRGYEIYIYKDSVIKGGDALGEGEIITNIDGDPAQKRGADVSVKLQGRTWISVTPKKLLTPLNLRVTEADDDSINLEWDEVANARGYLVEYRLKDSNADWQKCEETEDEEIEIDELERNKTYEIRIKALPEEGHTESEYAYKEATTKKTSLEEVSISGTVSVGRTLTATVEPDDAEVDYAWYRVNADTGEETKVGNAAEYTIQSADLGFVLTVKATGKDDYTGEVSAKTEAVTLKLATPENFEVIETTDASITVSWIAVNDKNVEGYVVEYCLNEDEEEEEEKEEQDEWDEWWEEWKVLDETTDTTLTIGDLQRNKVYSIRVKAISSEDSNYEDSNYSKLDATTKKTELTSVSIIGTATVGEPLLAVVAPSGANVAYAWYRSKAQGAEEPIGQGELYKVTQDDLGATLTVKATATESGDFTGEVTASTEVVTEVKLATPKNFQVIETTDASITVAWDAVDKAKDYLVEYRVYGSTDAWTPLANTTDTTQKIEGLKRNTRYAVRVKADATEAYAASEYANLFPTTAKIALTNVTITGKVEVGQTLKATVAPNDAAADYAWYRLSDGTPVGFGAEYKVTTEDAGSSLTVFATATGDFTGEVYASTTAVPKAKLATPQNFKSTSITDESIAVSWKSVPNANKYSLEYKGSKEEDWSIIFVEGTTFTVGSLDVADQTYQLRVKAIGTGTYADSEYAQIAVTSYLDEEGQTEFTEATVVTSEMKGDWNTGWYVAVGSVETTNAAVRCVGHVRLILADGCNLTIKPGSGNAGINVTPSDGRSLTIYGQSEGTGVLNAYASRRNAAIGGASSQDGGNITINGGVVNAIATVGGVTSGAGIGGGEYGSGYNITINGGTVYAHGGDESAGIGGGKNASNITINGGKVKAVGGNHGAGIGGGGGGGSLTDGNAENITISGGYVEVSGGHLAAGIGGGRFGNCNNVTITGGVVSVTGGKRNAAEVDDVIGAGMKVGSASNIKVSTDLTTKVGADEKSMQVVDNKGGDLTNAFRGKHCAKIGPKASSTTPENFQATETTDDSIAVSWDAVEDASSYRVEYRVKGSGSAWTVLDLTDTTFNIDGLKPNTTYRVRVKALGDDGYSDYVKLDATTERVALTSVSISGTAEVGATLTATVEPGDATATYAWYRSGVSAPVGTGTTYEITAEDVGAVLTVKATGTGDYTGEVSASTEVLTPVQQLTKPKKFQATSTTDASITVSWKAVANASAYQVEYRVKGSGKKWTVLETTDTTITVDGLKSDKTYRVRVKALGSGAYLDSDYSKLDATTLAAIANDDEDEAIPTGTAASNAWNLSGVVGVVAPVAAIEVAPVEAPTFAKAGKIASDVRSDVFATLGEDEFDALDLDVAFDALV